jgi:hypothetical protein
MYRILIITPKQPSGNPRMRKAANALARAGNKVHVLYAFNANWATQADEEILAQAQWTWERIGGHPDEAKFTYFISRLTRKLAEKIGMTKYAMCRSYSEYVARGLAWKPDLVIGHNPGALGPLVTMGKKLNIPMLFDAEDYHRGEFALDSQESLRVQKLEDECIPQVAAMTAASPLIAKAYQALYPQHEVTTINNAFPKKNQPPRPTSKSGPLKILWFSQVVGLDRGLAEFLQGMQLAKNVPIQLNVLGLCSDDVQQHLLGSAPSELHQITLHPPMAESALFGFIAEHEIGLALEVPMTENREICRTNKLYSFALAGCHMLISKTPAQEQFLREFPDAGELIDLHEPKTIADALGVAFEKRDQLLQKRQRAWQLGDTKLNWEVESEGLVGFVHQAFKP